MQVQTNIQDSINKLNKVVDADISNYSKVMGGLAVSFVRQKLRDNGSVVTANLLNSITYSTYNYNSPVSDTDGTAIEKSDDKYKVLIGTNVKYAARVEFGFIGKDSLGRAYNQSAKSFLRAGIEENKERLLSIFKK